MIAGETVRFAMRYPPGHELAGQLVERKQTCSRCGKEFTQQRIDREYLNSLYEHKRNLFDAFLRTCQVENKEAWQPARCPKCDRAQLNNGVSA